MATLTLGTPAQFDSSEAGDKSICRLTDTKFAIAFVDVTDSNKGKVIIGDISGTTITITDDNADTFESGQTKSIEIKRVDDTHFVIAYKDLSDTNKVKAIACSVSGTTITLGSILTVDSANCRTDGGCGVAVLDSTYMVFCYTDNASLKGRLASISGTTITLLGSETELDSTAVGVSVLVKTATLDSTHAVIIYPNFIGSSNVCVIAISVDTGTPSITAGTRVTPYATVVDEDVSISAFDSRYFITGYDDDITAGEVEGVTITAGSAVELEADAKHPAVFCLDSTHWGCAYFDDADTDKGKVTMGTHAAKVLTEVDEANEFEADDTDAIAACKMTNEYFMIAYKHA